MLAALTPDTELIIPISVLCTLLIALIIATWRLANFMRDMRDEVRGTWSVRDQEVWALAFERENRARGNAVFVPDVRRAPDLDKAG